MHRTWVSGEGPDSRCECAVNESTPVRVLTRPSFRCPDFMEKPDRGPVEPDLIDRLVSPGCPQLGRPVGGQHNERNASLGRLEHRRVQVGRGRTASGHDNGGNA